VTRSIATGLLIAASCWLLASGAHASGFFAPRINAERDHAAAPTPFALYFNPAALAGTRRIHMGLDLTLVVRGASYDRTATAVPEPSDAQGANLGKSKLLDAGAGPSLAGSLRLGDFVLGLGVFPGGGGMRWQGNEQFRGNSQYPGAVDGTARWHAIEGVSQLLYFSGGASYTIRAIGLSLGVGANLIYAGQDYVRAYTVLANDDLDIEGRMHIDASGVSGSFALGALLEILPEQLWLGVSYQAPPGLYGGLNLSGDVTTDLGGTGAVEVRQVLPDIVRAALRYRAERYELRLFGDYTRWSSFEMCAAQSSEGCSVRADGSVPDDASVVAAFPAKYSDTFAVRAGASYFWTRWEAFAGAGWDGSAAPLAYLNPLLMDGNDLSGSLGARVGLGDHVTLSLAYTFVYWLPRDSTGKSRLYELERPSRVPPADGKYTQWMSMLSAVVELYFD
jgi:long-chain fatty acid transport protein